MKSIRICLFIGTALALPTAALAQQAPAQENPCDQLVRMMEERQGGTNLPLTLDQARTYQRNGDEAACRTGVERLEAMPAAQADQPAGQAQPATQAQGGQPPAPAGQADGGTIVVQQPAPAVRVDQAAPQVTIQQAQPSVTVRQGQPEILVRQPAPTITIDIPQPEIIVRMPPPDVAVAQAQPQVEVNQPAPQVQVIQPEQQAQVQLQRSEAQVNVTQPEQQANVQIEQTGQPIVRYERAEPQVTINQAEGQPSIRVEQLTAEQAARGQQQAAVDNMALRPIPIATLDDMDVINERGEQIGDVEEVLIGPDSKVWVVVGHGGFLGLGEKEIALSTEYLWLQDDKLVVNDLTDEDIKALPKWADNDQYRVTDQPVEFRAVQ